MPPFTTEHFCRNLLSAWSIACSFFLATIAEASDSNDNQPAWTMRVKNGDVYRGLVGTASSFDSVSWECPSFASPLVFPWSAIESIEKNQSIRGARSDENGESSKLFAVELHSGVTLSGKMVSIDQDRIQLQVTGMDLQTLPLAEIKNVLRIFSASNEPVQVMQAEDWQQVLPAPKNGKATKWFLKAGEIATDTSGTTISQWGSLPPLATMDIDVAWEQPTVNWWLTIGEPRRMELQVRKLQNKNLLNVTLLVENSRDADVATVQIPYPKDSKIGLRLLCDADKGVYVLMQEDTVLGRIKGNPSERIVGRNKFSFTNTAVGVLTLRDLRISDRPFAIPETTAELQPGLAEIMTRGRGTFVGGVESAPANAEVRIRSANGVTTSIALEEIERIEFSKRIPDAYRESRPDLLRLDLNNGLRFVSDQIVSLVPNIASGRTTTEVSSPGVCLKYSGGQLCVPWDAIERIARLRSDKPIGAADPSEQHRSMQLVTADVVSTGRVDSVLVLDNGIRTLSWLPATATAAAPIHPGVDGVIEPSTTQQTSPDKKASRTPPLASVRSDAPKPEIAASRELRPEEPSLFLVSGDCFPGKVMSGSNGNDEGMEFQSPLFERTQVPWHQVRGVRIVEYEGLEALDRAARARLLTLTRMQRKNPPTHLIVSRDGDIVRGRLLSFDRDTLRVEVRGEELQLAMKNVAELIWLEPAPPVPNKAITESTPHESLELPAVTPTSSLALYQILLHQGSRVSISPEKVTGDELVGEHPFLGPCTLPWERISRVVLGDAIQADSTRSRFGKWKLLNAPDPKFVNEGTEEQNDAPVDTALDRLIGKPAPDQDLLKLDGTPFRLADYRGKIVILDFWATWCGPCLQIMPRIHQISREYTDAGVEAVFVNLEESEDRVRKMLERLELVPTVALDTDGSFAKQYAVQAIPQTVVIDREGVILKAFVGGGDQTERELIGVLNDLTKN
jgi:thiol-disulfide isomerase/thioredoxin